MKIAEGVMENIADKIPSCERFVRKQKYIHCDDPRYSKGNDIENRVEPPPIEVKGDALDRQRCIFDFDQNRIDAQSCLILGAGGIGQNVGLTLARLGVRSITFVDKDTYETSNLSRQLLGSGDDIGKRKVDVAVNGIVKCHDISGVIVEGCHLDAMASWDKVVGLAQRNSVIFNGIDVGTVFDFAVNSLSKALSVPLVQGQSAGWSVNAEFYSGQPGLLCGACTTSITTSFALEGSSFRAINDRLADWIVHHDNYHFCERTGTTSEDAIEAFQLPVDMLLQFLEQDKQYRVSGPTVVNIVRNVIRSVNSSTSNLSPTSNAVEFIFFRDFNLFLAEYYKHALQLLLPDRICCQTDILFIPQPRGVPTRYVGSWVCPCLIAAAVMVSQWVNYLTGPTLRDPPSSFQLSLASCRTDICDRALECGFVDPPSQSNDPSSSSCVTCAKTSIKLEEQLFFSLVKIPLQPIAGRVYMWTGEKMISTAPRNVTETPAISTDVEIRGGTLWYNIDHLGTDYSDLALDAVPCRRDECDLSSGVYTEVCEAGLHHMWPAELMRPLGKSVNDLLPIDMRGMQEELNYVCAYSSGQRSALIRATPAPLASSSYLDEIGSQGEPSRWYRLKGCGMPHVGFTVEDALDDNGKPIQAPFVCSTTVARNAASPEATATTDARKIGVLRKIRGAAYQHTCAIELEMTTIVATALKSVGMVCANISLGRWDYDHASLPSTVPSEYPLVIRSCALFENLGDKRLNDHVLRGLELLLPLVASFPVTEGTLSTLSAPQSSALHALQSVRDMETVSYDDLDVEKYDEFDGRLTRAVLLYNGGSSSPIGLFADLAHPSTGLEGINVPLADDFPATAPKDLKCIWEQCCKVLASSPTAVSLEHVLPYLYYRLGRECGTVGRILHENNIMWGSYVDATGRHMNAHGNNLALLREQKGSLDTYSSHSEAFLAPLDFDMSYTRDNCYFGSGSREKDLKTFDELSECELSELGFNLSMSQSGKESTTSGTKPPCALPADLGIVRLALRDTLVRGWLSATQGLEDEHPPQPALRDRAYAVLKLALILTWDVAA